MHQDDPPFDDNPCPACPREVRALYAAAANATGSMERWIAGEESWQRVLRKLHELKAAVETMAPIVAKHFEDNEHSGVLRQASDG